MKKTFKAANHDLAMRVVRRGARALYYPVELAARRYLGVVTRVATEEAALALTFDDGPHPEHTPALLDILAKHDARATFFMVGELAARQPAIVRAVAQGGHAIGNHSWSHLSFPLLTMRERYDQLRRCEEALAPYGAKFFRPAYCHQNVASRWHVLRSGYDVVGFSAHAEDWLDRSAAWMSERLLREARPGAIIILHDNIYRSVLPAAQPDRRPMLAAVNHVLDQLRGRFRFVTVPELLQLGKPIREYWYRREIPEMRPALERHLLEQRQQAGLLS